MTKKLILCSLLFINSCGAQPNENYAAEAKVECEFSFQKLNKCPHKTLEHDLTVTIESENIAEDEKLIKAVKVDVNSIQQTFAVSPDTTLLDGDIGYISFADINFDKIPDLAITTSFGTPNLYLDYWVYDTKQKKYTPVGNYPKFTINEKKKTLSAKVKSNAENYQNIEWSWNGNTLQKR